MNIWQLSMGIFVSGTLAIWFGYRQPEGGFYLFKPLTLLLIILIPVLGGVSFTPLTGLILAGLLFSLLGDIFLMLPSDPFLAGLVAFLIAHLCYGAGFLIDQGEVVFWPTLPLFSLVGVIGWLLKGGMGKMKTPGMIYMGVITIMVWLSWSRWINGGELDHLLAFCGAVSFMLSDLLLAVNRFKVSFKAARGLNLAAYYAGQCLIALSLIDLEGGGLLPGF